MTPPRFERHGGPRRDEEEADPEEETIFTGLKTLEPWEVALFFGAIITSLIIWLVFIWVHGGFPSVGWFR